MKLAIIPARGGSKRITRKNVKAFCGKPMLAWPIEAARLSGCFDRVIVSTDDPEIAEVASAYGAEVPFVRPSELADDRTGTVPVIAHAVEWQRRNGAAPVAACCIYATTPLLDAVDLRRGHRLLVEKNARFAVSVTHFPSPIQRALRVDRMGHLQMFWPENYSCRSQDLEPAFHDAGQFYWGTAQAWLSASSVFGPDTVPVILPSFRVQDIDRPEDWTRAEAMKIAVESYSSGDDDV